MVHEKGVLHTKPLPKETEKRQPRQPKLPVERDMLALWRAMNSQEAVELIKEYPGEIDEKGAQSGPRITKAELNRLSRLHDHSVDMLEMRLVAYDTPTLKYGIVFVRDPEWQDRVRERLSAVRPLTPEDIIPHHPKDRHKKR